MYQITPNIPYLKKAKSTLRNSSGFLAMASSLGFGYGYGGRTFDLGLKFSTTLDA